MTSATRISSKRSWRAWTTPICRSPCRSVLVISPSRRGISVTTNSIRTPW
jgi:hypothetical protein